MALWTADIEASKRRSGKTSGTRKKNTTSTKAISVTCLVMVPSKDFYVFC